TELAELKKHNEAIILFDKILKEHPKNGTVIYAKARSKAEIGDNNDALVLLAQAISYYGKTIKGWAIKDSSFDRLKEDLKFKMIVK
ncbi:MAG: TPR end-of-group domain-containing protein, partial [Nitrosopumilaceae archaeon]